MSSAHALSAAASAQPEPPVPPWYHDLVARARSLAHARQAHAQAAARGLLSCHLPTCAALVLTYSALLDPASARRVFNSSPLKLRGAFLWNALIRALSKLALHDDALGVYNSMLHSNIRPDDRTYPFVLKVCSEARAAHKGREVHGSVLKLGFEADVFVGNTLLSFYGACGDVNESVKVFEEMPKRDIVSWNSIISVFSANGCSLDSMNLFLELTESGIPINSVSLVSTLPACAVLEDEVFGMGVHGLVIKLGLDTQVTVGNAFVDMYGKCGNSEASMQVFYCMLERNDVSWNSIIGRLVHVGKFEDALEMFRDMVANDEVKLNSVTISSLLPALVELGCFELGREVHGYSVRTGMDFDVFVSNSLVDMYAKSGWLKKASDVFYGMKSRNAVSWNAMIANFTQNGAELDALRLVRDMQVSGECPNSVTFTNVLPACARIASLKKGKEIHARAIHDGTYGDLFVSNALIDMYAKCGRLELARHVFNISERDQVSYNTLIVGYSQSTWCSEALHLFLEMRIVGHDHDVVSFMGALSACANLHALKQGKEIHALSIRKAFHSHLFVANSLLDLYVKSGKLGPARMIFDRILNKDVASWNSMVLGYGMQCELETAINLFDMMEDDGVEYDHVSYIAVLSACSHGGMVERGKKYFNQMLAQNIKLTQMHYACMVDLLGRAGLMKEAEDCIRGMPFEADSNVWGALLGACRVHGNIKLARWAAEHLFELKPGHSGYYILLSNMYAEVGRWEEANEVRKLMKSRKVKKNPGCSWVDGGHKMRAFIVGDRLEGPEVELSYGEEMNRIII